MDAVARNWKNFKFQPEIWFFYAFLLTWPLSIRKILVTYPIGGIFNEYSTISIYFSDLFLAATILIWLISILKNKLYNLSIDSIFIVSRGTLPILITILLFNLWSFFSIFWSFNDSIAIFRFLKVFEFSFLFFFLAANPRCSTWNFLKKCLLIIIVFGVVNSAIAAAQFIIQRSLGLSWLRESLISPNLPGIAKVIFNNRQFIRSYGLFPHPNILGGFLTLSILVTLSLRNSFMARLRFLRCFQSVCSTWNLWQQTRFNRLIFSFILGIQIFAAFLTFSKSAMLALVIGVVYYLISINVSQSSGAAFRTRANRGSTPASKDVPRGTFRLGWNIRTWLRVFQSRIKDAYKNFKVASVVILLLTVPIIGLFMAKFDFNTFFVKSWLERLALLSVAKNMIESNFLTGTGIGQFVPTMSQYAAGLQSWQFQPVHNVPLLILSDLGIVGLLLVLYFLWRVFHVEYQSSSETIECSTGTGQHCEGFSHSLQTGVPRETTVNRNRLISLFRALIIAFLVIALFDHYLWDIQAGQVTLWMTLGFLAAFRSRH